MSRTEVERKPAELTTSDADLRLILDNIPGMVVVFSGDFARMFVNNQTVEYFGVAEEELEYWESRGFTHPEDNARTRQHFSKTRNSGKWDEYEVRFRRFDGVYRWFQTRGTPLRDASGRVVRWYTLLTDIDDRKRAEEALAASERNLRLIVDSIPGMIAVFSADGELQFVNNQLIEYFGAPLEEQKKWRTNGFTHPEDTARSVEVFARSIASGEPYDVEVRARRFDGVYRWFHSRATPLRDDSGRVVRWYNLLSDIDDRKRAESELRQLCRCPAIKSDWKLRRRPEKRRS
jgi:PAS domain S-box-containing protein